MRWRIGVVFFLFVAYVAIGCRAPLTPNIDRNQAPETWITAAPFDTVTIKNDRGNPIGFPFPGTIPVRFHLYWTGSDKDGAVSGFYWAVVETLPRAAEGQFFLPNLPGPKPQDYHYTTKTDSTFIFQVAEDIPDRQHAFFIYAVDNLGKPDPTPARFIFNALDRFPPIPIIDECRCIGSVYSLNAGGGVTPHPDTVYVTDVDNRAQPIPRDTCSATSWIHIRWHGQPQIPQSVVTGFRYKLDEPQFVEVGPEVLGADYHTGIPPDTIPPSPGLKIFVLRAIDQALGTRDSTRRFQLNYAPETWWSGPDINSSSLTTKPNGERYLWLPPGKLTTPVAGSLMSDDSVKIMPAYRARQTDYRKNTFFEIWKDTLWARTEGDTVHFNSWVIVHNGGFDRDSRYGVRVSPLARDPNFFPDFPGGPVLTPGPPNGSAIGFRSLLVMSMTPEDTRSGFAQTGLYPIFDPNDVFNKPEIAGYQPILNAGRAVMPAQAEAADGDRDKRVQNCCSDGRALVLSIENGTATPDERGLRDQVLTFYTDYPPYFVTSSPLFRPRTSVVDTFNTNLWDLRLVANDDDPWSFQTSQGIGGPSTVLTLRRTLTVHGKDDLGNDFVFQDPVQYLNLQNINLLVPTGLAGGLCTLEVELCDCDKCEENPGTGRCITLQIPVYYKKPPPAQPASMTSSRGGSDALRK
jgi:hypothetical protein